MLIKLSPQRRDDTLSVVKSGSVLTVNGEDFDLGPMSEGSTLPRVAITSEWFVGDVDMQDGEISLTLLLPLPVNYSPEQAFPQDLVDVPDGPVIFPAPLSDEETAAKFPPMTVKDSLNQMPAGDALEAWSELMKEGGQ